jgi:hypothetical protein
MIGDAEVSGGGGVSRETPWMQMVISVEVCSADGDGGLGVAAKNGGDG